MLPAADDASRRRCWRSSAARPVPASRRWSTRWSVAGSPRPGCSGRRPARRCWCTTPTTPTGSARTGCCPTWCGSTTSTDDRHSLQLVASDTDPARAWRSWTRPTSTRSRSATARLAAQLLAAADLWLFVTSAARYSDQVPWEHLKRAAERSTSVAIVLDRTPADAVPHRRRAPGPDARQPRAQGLPAVHGHRGARSSRRACSTAAEVADIRGWLVSLAERPRRPRRRRPADARRHDPHAGAPDPRARRRARPSSCAAAEALRAAATTAYDAAAAARSSPQPPTAPCCAARCSPGGRSSSAPASCCARSTAGSAGSADRRGQRGQGLPPAGRAGHASRSSPAVELMVLDHAEAAAGRDRARPGRSSAPPGRSLAAADDDLGRAVARPAPPRRGRGARLAAAS